MGMIASKSRASEQGQVLSEKNPNAHKCFGRKVFFRNSRLAVFPTGFFTGRVFFSGLKGVRQKHLKWVIEFKTGKIPFHQWKEYFRRGLPSRSCGKGKKGREFTYNRDVLFKEDRDCLSLEDAN